MKRYLALSLLAVSAFAQAPQLSTADKVAIEAIESQRNKANSAIKSYDEQEAQIVKEWNANHVGYHLNAKTYEVEKDAPKPEVKAEPKK